jgi:membrane protein insertase Oxa1/YidC/SpoIIIJ
MNFLGIIDITKKSIWLALGAGVSQYLHAHLTIPKVAPKVGTEPNLKEDFMRNMQTQIKYVMPVLIVVIAYSISATIALYLFVSNLTSLAQEYFIRKHR